MNADATRTITAQSHPQIKAADLLSARSSGARIHIDGEGSFRVVSVLMNQGAWSARLAAEDDDPPRGPLTEPRRRRG